MEAGIYSRFFLFFSFLFFSFFFSPSFGCLGGGGRGIQFIEFFLAYIVAAFMRIFRVFVFMVIVFNNFTLTATLGIRCER